MLNRVFSRGMLCLLCWCGGLSDLLLAQAQVPDLWQSFQQARLRQDHREALQVLAQFVKEGDVPKKFLDQTDFFQLQAALNSRLPIGQAEVQTLLAVQGQLVRQHQNASGWAIQRGLTAIYYRHWVADSLLQVLTYAITKAPDEVPFLFMRVATESLMDHLAHGRISLIEALRVYADLAPGLVFIEQVHPDKITEAQALFRQLGDRLRPKLPTLRSLGQSYRKALAEALLKPAEYHFIFLCLDLRKEAATAFSDSICKGVVQFVPHAYLLSRAAAYWLQQEHFDLAQQAYESALALPQAQVWKAQTQLALARLFWIRRNFRTARLYAMEADALCPDWGRPWLFLAEMVITSAPLCDFSPLERKALNWLAIEYAEEAMNRNPHFREEARKRIRQYAAHMPTRAQVLYYGLQIGDRFPIGCWIEEAARVRY